MDKFSELKAAALAATPGPWVCVDDGWSDGDHANITSDERSDSSIIDIAQINGGGTESDFDHPFSTEQQANAAFIAAANPAAILALLAELEEVTMQRDNAQSSRDLHAKVNTGLNERLIAAEAKLATPVRLPNPGTGNDPYSLGRDDVLHCVASDLRKLGFTVEGDE